MWRREVTDTITLLCRKMIKPIVLIRWLSSHCTPFVKASEEENVKDRSRNKLILFSPTQMSFLSFTCASTPSDRTAWRMSLLVACRSNESRGRWSEKFVFPRSYPRQKKIVIPPRKWPDTPINLRDKQFLLHFFYEWMGYVLRGVQWNWSLSTDFDFDRWWHRENRDISVGAEMMRGNVEIACHMTTVEKRNKIK